MFKTIFISILLIFQAFFVSFSFADSLDDVFETSKNNNNQIIEDDISDDEDKVESYITNITKIMLNFAVIIGVAVFLYGGVRFLLSMGDDSKAKKTRDTLIVSGVGLIIAFGSYVILQVIISIGSSF